MEETNKMFKTVITSTVRDLIKEMNDKQLSKEDVISLIPLKGQYILIYYK